MVDCFSRFQNYDERAGEFRTNYFAFSSLSQIPNALPSVSWHTAKYPICGTAVFAMQILPESFAVCIIPYTKRSTNLQGAQPGDWVNIEFDILAKYLERMLARYAPRE